MGAIQTRDLSRRFGDVTAVDSLDLDVKAGEIYGFLGPNGAGKSTTINMLLGFMPPSSGRGTVAGFDIVTESRDIRQAIGILPENVGLYGRLTARKHVQFAIDVKGADDDAEALLDRVGMKHAINRKTAGFSTGMKQRLALAMALVGEPEILILDEPSSGLDPNGARDMRTIIREEHDRGATIFFSSHIMEQVEAICDRVGILRQGRLVAEDSIDSLKGQFEAESRIIVTVDDLSNDPVAALESLDGVTGVVVNGHDISVGLTDATWKARVINTVESTDTAVTDIRSIDPSLEDLFVAYTNDTAATVEAIDS